MQDKIVIHIELFNFDAADGQLIEDIRIAQMMHRLKGEFSPEIRKLQQAGISDKNIITSFEEHGEL